MPNDDNFHRLNACNKKDKRRKSHRMKDDSPSFHSPGKHLALVGGFLGAGKTTLIARLARWLMARGCEVGIVTNDQGTGLVDTQTAKELESVEVSEISGGCFCCRLDQLVEQLGERWLAVDRSPTGLQRPLTILAEPVGSCTDLVATVILPLEKVYRIGVGIAPFSVVLDGRRALSALGGRKSRRDFSKDVSYIYRKQIEEAQWLVINKADLLSSKDMDDLRARLDASFPHKRVFVVSAKTGEGCEAWFEALREAFALPRIQDISTGKENQAQESAPVFTAPTALDDIDYQRYGVGEALLGWYNATLTLDSPAPFDGNAWLLGLGAEISKQMDRAGCEVAHFKMSLESKAPAGGHEGAGERARVHQVISEDEPVLSEHLKHPITKALLLINLRAEGAPNLLENLVTDALDICGAEMKVVFQEKAAFRPGQPVPVHRIAG